MLSNSLWSDPDGPPMNEEWSELPFGTGMVLNFSTNPRCNITFAVTLKCAASTRTQSRPMPVPSRSSSVLEEDQGMIIKPSGKLEPRTSISMWMPTLLDSMTEPDHDPISIRSKTGYYIINLSKSPLVWKALFKDLSAVTAVKTSTGL